MEYVPAETDVRLAKMIFNAKRKSTEELNDFVEISCTTSPSHLVYVRKAYCLLLDSSLAEYTATSIPFPPAKVFVFWYHTF